MSPYNCINSDSNVIKIVHQILGLPTVTVMVLTRIKNFWKHLFDPKFHIKILSQVIKSCEIKQYAKPSHTKNPANFWKGSFHIFVHIHPSIGLG